MTGDRERGSADARATDLEAAPSRSHVTRGVTARTVAVEAADRGVVAGRRDHGDVVELRVHRRAVTGEAPGDALMRAGGRVDREVARGRVALRARRGGRNVVGRLGAAARLIGGECRCRRVTAVAVTGGRMGLVECGARIRCGGAASEHSHVGRALVTGYAATDRRRPGGGAGNRDG